MDGLLPRWSGKPFVISCRAGCFSISRVNTAFDWLLPHTPNIGVSAWFIIWINRLIPGLWIVTTAEFHVYQTMRRRHIHNGDTAAAAAATAPESAVEYSQWLFGMYVACRVLLLYGRRSGRGGNSGVAAVYLGKCYVEQAADTESHIPNDIHPPTAEQPTTTDRGRRGAAAATAPPRPPLSKWGA